MLINYLVNKCNERYSRNMEQYGHKVVDSDNCEGYCCNCLNDVHFPKPGATKRTYDCPVMADYYYCRYSYRYASEIVYGLRQFKDLMNLNKLNVLSIGCGPCTELAALDYLQKKGEYSYSQLDFRGIDPLKGTWVNIWSDIEAYFNGQVKFFEKDIYQFVDTIVKGDWVPDLIVFQYVFSDMAKKSTKENITEFLHKLTSYVNAQTGKNIYILVNDANASLEYGAGRDFFDILADRIGSTSIVKRLHFNINRKTSHFHYGIEYASNDIFFDIPDYIKGKYGAWDSCASAQILIKKVA